MSRRSVILAILVIGIVSIIPVEAKVVVAPLTPHHPPSGFSFPDSDRTVSITVVDERPDKTFLAAALIGRGAEKDKGVYLGYGTPGEDDLASFMTRAATEAAATLGVKPGDGARLEIVVRAFTVDMYRLSGFSPMNCVGYGVLGVTLTAADGSDLRKTELRVAYYDNAMPVVSMKEVTAKGLSRIFTLAAWQATATTLIDAFGLVPDPARLKALIEQVEGERDEDPAREMVFWLGLTGHGNEAVKEKLLSWFRTSRAQKVYQTALEAMALLGIDDARGDVEGILSGRVEITEWDIEDNEQVWYLLHGLAMMGEKDLAARRPTGKLKMLSKIDDLLSFHSTGELPTASAKEQEKAAKAKKKLEDKRH